ncbi:unnamed protein product [Durusdinium trenchii]|uniref:Uncharacterized protein n=1 Tax=Durusdinium trenchii TaxID=1381693 RepID=A0ABP0N7Q5_9DINO
MMTTHVMPVTAQQGKLSGTPHLWINSVGDADLIKMSGNAMSLPCASAENQILQANVLVLQFQKASEGLPVLTDWLRNAGDFWAVGFEAWREPIEVRPVDDAVLGAAMRPRCLVPTKGISRASIILFGVCYTYSNLRNSMESEETQDFVRFLATLQRIPLVLMECPGHSLSMFSFRRIQLTEQQTEKQRKNLLQKCLIFTQRARELQAEAGVCDEAWSMIEKHLHRYRFAESAFHINTINLPQWLVGSAPTSGCNALWHSILTVSPEKQVLFLRRVFFMHERAVQRKAKATAVRIPTLERMCLMQHVLQEMRLAVHDNGTPVFEPDMIQKSEKRALDGDYSSELSEQLLLKDGTFQPHLMTLWSENLPAMINECPEKSFVAVDEEINKLDNNARDAHFRQDCLKLTRDCATLGLLYKSEAKHERAVKVQKVSHLKAQNTTGANFIKGFMCANHKHVAGRVGELEAAMDEFVSALLKLERFKKGALIVWVDFTKFGRVCNNDLNDTLDVLQTTISRLPERACAFIVGPHLISEKVQNGLRIEDKLDALGIYSEMVMLRMSEPPGQKHVPLQFPAWICMDEGSRDQNWFKGCQLMLDRCTRQSLPWTPESAYVVPAIAKDAPPTSAEIRSLSQCQESAQLLCGHQLPEQVLNALIGKTDICGCVGVVNLSPYDTWLERSCLKWGKKSGGEIIMPTLSLSKNLTVLSYSERSFALQLMQDCHELPWNEMQKKISLTSSPSMFVQDWKNGSHFMGSAAPKYEPEAPPAESIDISKFPLQVVRLERNPSESHGWKKWKITLPQSFRMFWLDDVVYSPEWRELISDFDNKLLDIIVDRFMSQQIQLSRQIHSTSWLWLRSPHPFPHFSGSLSQADPATASMVQAKSLSQQPLHLALLGSENPAPLTSWLKLSILS